MPLRVLTLMCLYALTLFAGDQEAAYLTLHKMIARVVSQKLISYIF